MLPLRIAARFLKASPWQSLFIALGIAVGIATQLFVALLITSLQGNLVDTVVGNSPQVTLTAAKEGDPLTWSGEPKQVVTGDSRVTAIAPVRLSSALFVEGTASAPLSIIGGDLPALDAIYKVSGRIAEGSVLSGDNEVVLGTDFAKKYGVAPGDTVKLAFAGKQPRDVLVSGLVDLGAAEANLRTAFASKALVGEALGWTAEDEYSAIEVQLDDPFVAGDVASSWKSKLGSDFAVTDWQSSNADLLQALSAQSASSYMIQTFVLVAVAIGIASTLAISAVQKTRQIGILKALGMSDGATGLVFLWEGAILGILGTLLGIALGIGFAALFYVIPVPFSINLAQPVLIGISAAVGIGVALASALVPLRKTARLEAIEVIQNG